MAGSSNLIGTNRRYGEGENNANRRSDTCTSSGPDRIGSKATALGYPLAYQLWHVAARRRDLPCPDSGIWNGALALRDRTGFRLRRERVGYTEIENLPGLRTWQGKSRLVATSIERGSESLPNFQFVVGDVIAPGNEYDGLPPELESRADCKLRIPMADVWTPKPRSSSPIDPTRTAPVAREGSPNLNVAMAGAIICYTAHTQALQRWLAGQDIVA